MFFSRLDCRERVEIKLDPSAKFYKSYKDKNASTDEVIVAEAEQHEDEMSSSDDHLFPLGSTEPSFNAHHSHLLPLDTFGTGSLNDIHSQEQHSSSDNVLVDNAEGSENPIDGNDEMSSTDDIWIAAAMDEIFSE